MSKRLAAVLCFAFALPALAQNSPSASVEAAPAADAGGTILVVGQRPGPGLWKISKDDHVLWVFGTFSPLPQKMEWRSHEVESILAKSQEYVGPPGLHVGVGLLKGLTLLPHLIGFKKNPDGAQLRDVLPADAYARWLPLKAKYIGSDSGIESYRPLFAADELLQKGLAQAGLTKGHEVRKAIEQLAKKDKLKMTFPELHMELDDPGKAAREFKKGSVDDAACFARTLDWLEGDIEATRKRANAWALGDVAALKKLAFAEREDACKHAILTSGAMQSQPQLVAARARMYDVWLAAVEKALAANASSFTLLELKDILDPNGPLAALQAKGYKVESPE